MKNIIFAGTPEFSASILSALLQAGYPIRTILTQPDRPKGRGRKLSPSPVKQLALEHQLEVHQPVSLKTTESITQLKALQPDLIIVVAYGLLLPQEVLDIPKLGCINVHASLLPRWRGAAPIQHSILAGDKETGISIMQMDQGLDTGAVLKTLSCPIDTTETSQTLHDKLSFLGAKALIDVLSNINSLVASPQDDSLATYAHKINKADAKINWHSSAIEIDRQIRAFNPWPITFTSLHDKTIRIIEASLIQNELGSSPKPGTINIIDNKLFVATEDGYLELLLLQLPGGKALPALELLKGHPTLFITGENFE